MSKSVEECKQRRDLNEVTVAKCMDIRRALAALDRYVGAIAADHRQDNEMLNSIRETAKSA